VFGSSCPNYSPYDGQRTNAALSLRIPRAIIQQKRIKDIQRFPTRQNTAVNHEIKVQDEGNAD
jgi:hypothetical protein